MGKVLRNASKLNSPPPKYSSQELEYWWKEEVKFNFWNFHVKFSTILANPRLVYTKHGEKKQTSSNFFLDEFSTWRHK